MEVDWMRGCGTALLTPFNSEGALDVGRLRALVERQIDGGIRMLVPCGTTGESQTMTEDEDRLVIRTTVETARGRAKVIAGTGSNSTSECIRYSVAAREIGADAALLVAPYYNKPTQEGMYQHYMAIAREIDGMPMVLYNVPGRTASNLSAETVLRLAREVDHIVAVKEASANFTQIMEILRGRPAGFRVLSGDDSLTLPMIALGADGLISVASNEVPEPMVGMIDAALAGDWDGAREIHFRMLELMEANFMESSPGPAKAVMAMLGLMEERLRLPLVPVAAATRERLRAIIAGLGLTKGNSDLAA